MSALMKSFVFEGAEVRVLELDGKPWWVAADLADVLGYTHVPHMVRMLADDQKAIHSVALQARASCPESGQEGSISSREAPNRNVVIVTEGGLWTCVIRSQVSAAKRFVRWLTDVLLPTLRTTGRYAFDDQAHPLSTGPSGDQIALAQAHLPIISIMKEVRLAGGREAAIRIWHALGGIDVFDEGTKRYAAVEVINDCDRIFGEWFKSRIEFSGDSRTKFSVLREDYCEFCDSVGETPASYKYQSRQLSRFGLESVKNSSVYWIGIKLKSNAGLPAVSTGDMA